MPSFTTRSAENRYFYENDPWHNFKSKFISDLYSWVIDNIEQFPEFIKTNKRSKIEYDMGLSTKHDYSIRSIVYDYFCEHIQDYIATEIMGVTVPPEIANSAFNELIRLCEENEYEGYLIGWVPSHFYTEKIMSSLAVYPLHLGN